MNKVSLGTSTEIQRIVNKIYATGQITRADQQGLMALIFSDQILGLKECQQISEIITRLHRGWLRVVD